MAAELKETLLVDAELISGGGGIFDVVADGKMIFSKHSEGDELPDNQEVIRRLQKLQASNA